MSLARGVKMELNARWELRTRAAFDGYYHAHFCPDCPADSAVYEHPNASRVSCYNYVEPCPGHWVQRHYGASV